LGLAFINLARKKPSSGSNQGSRYGAISFSLVILLALGDIAAKLSELTFEKLILSERTQVSTNSR